MRRKWVCVLVIALLMTLVNAEAASAKKSRSGRSVSRSQVKRGAYRSRASRATSRRERRGGKRYATRGRHGRRAGRARLSRSRHESSDVASSNASRPAPGIPAERVTEIQNALIKAGYLDGPASGAYDEATIEAMKQYQADNGLPRTGLPSAPVLKKLGVAKRSNDGYAVPVNAVSEAEKKKAP